MNVFKALGETLVSLGVADQGTDHVASNRAEARNDICVCTECHFWDGTFSTCRAGGEGADTDDFFFFFLKQDKSNMELCFDCDVAVVYNRKSVVTMQLVSVINGDFHIITGPRIVKKNVYDVFPLSTQ